MPKGNLLEQTHAAFATTRWTVLGGLRSEDEAQRRAAAEQAAATYWPPVYACARRLVHSREEAADLTQGFFTDVVLGRRLLERADAERGSLRSLIRSALKRYATDQWRRSSARGDHKTLPFGELDREDSLRIEGDSESAFDRRWALALFEEALRRCERHFTSNGKPGHWRLFEARVLHPAVHGGGVGALAADATTHGFTSPTEAAAAVQTVKRRFDAVFREVVAETLSDAGSLEQEYALIRALIEQH